MSILQSLSEHCLEVGTDRTIQIFGGVPKCQLFTLIIRFTGVLFKPLLLLYSYLLKSYFLLFDYPTIKSN